MTTVIFPNQYMLPLPERTRIAIAESQANYLQPLWHFRAERVLKLGQHQWIYPAGPTHALAAITQYPHGITCSAWKLFNRSWAAAAETYFADSINYPYHPRHWGLGVVPLVDEDRDGQHIGWVRILQHTQATEDFAVFVQFELLQCFAPQPLPSGY